MGNFFRSPSRGSSTTTRLPTESVYNARNHESGSTTSSWDDVQVEATGTTVTPTLKMYSFAQLKKATGNFRPGSMLGNGFGKVYRGWVNKATLAPSKTGVGIPVAVRKSNPGQSLQQWQAEVEFLGKFSHRNVVKLLGYCRDDKQFLLVYEYMHKGSLENHLFRNDGAGGLSWETRIKIAMGAAHGLAFLHTTKKPVKCHFFGISSILLDGEFNAKLLDFGKAIFEGDPGLLTDVVPKYKDTSHVYAAPEYVSSGRSDDVYSFGIVFLEMITGRRASDRRPTGEKNLVLWAKPFLQRKNTLKRIMDSKLEGKYPSEAAFQSAALVLKCLEHLKENRPSMDYVLEALECIRAIKLAP